MTLTRRTRQHLLPSPTTSSTRHISKGDVDSGQWKLFPLLLLCAATVVTTLLLLHYVNLLPWSLHASISSSAPPLPHPSPSPPYVLTFYSSTCLACRRIAPVLAECVNQIHFPFYSVRIDVPKNEHAHLITAYNLSFIPAIVFVTQNSHVQFHGSRDLFSITQFLKTQITLLESSNAST